MSVSGYGNSTANNNNSTSNNNRNSSFGSIFSKMIPGLGVAMEVGGLLTNAFGTSSASQSQINSLEGKLDSINTSRERLDIYSSSQSEAAQSETRSNFGMIGRTYGEMQNEIDIQSNAQQSEAGFAVNTELTSLADRANKKSNMEFLNRRTNLFTELDKIEGQVEQNRVEQMAKLDYEEKQTENQIKLLKRTNTPWKAMMGGM